MPAILPKTPPGLFADCEALVRFCQQNDASEMQAKAFKIEQAVKYAYPMLQTLFADAEEHVQCVDLLQKIMNDPNAVIRRADRLMAAKLIGEQP
jgi:hypothetical protein